MSVRSSEIPNCDHTPATILDPLWYPDSGGTQYHITLMVQSCLLNMYDLPSFIILNYLSSHLICP